MKVKIFITLFILWFESLCVYATQNEEFFIPYFRFIRNYTKGVEDSWTINALNYFKLADMLEEDK
jgi:hypothetical protein